MKLISAHEEAITSESEAVRKMIAYQLAQKKVELVKGGRVVEVTDEGAKLADGRFIEGNTPIWATGAEPHSITAESDLDLMKNFFRVNKYL